MGFIALIILFIIGACFGSFLCCQARRLHLKGNKDHKKLGLRSICLNCKTKLKWYDNIPIVSWLILKGKCRKCGKKIGAAEILSEFGLGLAFSLFLFGASLSNSALNLFLAGRPLSYAIFFIGFILILSLAFLAIYDGLYGELPVSFLIISIICAAIVGCYHLTYLSLTDLILSVFILGGIYLALYLISKGKWVGDGDWLLGAAIGFALGHPWLALLTLFLSNLLACLIMFPKAKGKNTKIPFGPFLVAAFFIVYAFSSFLLSML
ncbi:prepilin peptidase [Candidatus Saccharibacteria bacterium]|nr:prepilin peptidase [Candidatus Saccharibacteria bacterium]